MCVSIAFAIVLAASTSSYQGSERSGRIVRAYYTNGTIIDPSLTSDPIMVDLLIPSSEHPLVTTINSWLSSAVYAISCTLASIIVILGMAQVFIDFDVWMVPFAVVGLVIYSMFKLCAWKDSPHTPAADIPTITEPSPVACSNTM